MLIYKEAISFLEEEATKKDGIRRTDLPGKFIKPSVGLIVQMNINGWKKFVRITKLSNNPRKVYFQNSRLDKENGITDISILSYDEKQSEKHKDI